MSAQRILKPAFAMDADTGITRNDAPLMPMPRPGFDWRASEMEMIESIEAGRFLCRLVARPIAYARIPAQMVPCLSCAKCRQLGPWFFRLKATQQRTCDIIAYGIFHGKKING